MRKKQSGINIIRLKNTLKEVNFVKEYNNVINNT